MSILSQQKQSVNTDFPNLRPSLDLRFALSKTLDPRVKYTRGSPATYVDKDGFIKTVSINEPRFTHDPITGESLGLLMEDTRINSWLYSGQSVVTNWISTANTITFDNTEIAPDGTTNTIKFTESETYTGGLGFAQNISVTSGTYYTFSIFVKQPRNSPLRYCSILFFNTGFGEYKIATFNPSNGAILYTSGTLTTSVQKYQNDWWRFSVTAAASTTTTSQFSIRFTNSVSSSPSGFGGPYGNYAGDGSSYLYFYGPQVENNYFMSSFIPTSGSQVTRNADLANMTGTNFTSWYNFTEGSVYCQYRRSGIQVTNVSSPFPWGINDGTSANSIAPAGGFANPSQRRLDIRVSSTNTAQLLFTSSEVPNRFYKLCISYTENYPKGSFDGGPILYDRFCTIPTVVNRFDIGKRDPNSSTDHFIGTISRLTYYPVVLTDQQLINLTS